MSTHIFKAEPRYESFSSVPTELSATVVDDEIISYYQSDFQNAGIIHSCNCLSENKYGEFLKFKDTVVKKHYPDLYEKIKDFPEAKWNKPKEKSGRRFTKDHNEIQWLFPTARSENWLRKCLMNVKNAEKICWN